MGERRGSQLVNYRHEAAMQSLAAGLSKAPEASLTEELQIIINRIHADIPEKKRISYGRYSVIKAAGLCLYPFLKEEGANAAAAGIRLYEDYSADPFIRSLGIQLLSLAAVDDGAESGTLKTAKKYFEFSAADASWIVRECTAGFIRKLVKEFTDEMLIWYQKLVRSENPLQRRFACESLRPVADNGWFKKNPDFPWAIMPELFHEKEAYPRTSVGNSLSDWMRIDQERTLRTVKELASNGDENSYWIAYRACRNLVKKQPLLVLDILKTDIYKYKSRNYSRAGIQREDPSC